MRAIFAILLILCSTMPALAASPCDPAWRQVKFTAGYPWEDGLTIDIVADQAMCRQKYGDRWRERCALALGMPGETARGVTMTPPARGQWRWLTATTIVFRPEDSKSLQPDTLYKADLSGLAIPSFAHLDTLTPQCRTLPLGAQLRELKFMQNPAAGGAHRLAAAFNFNFPVPEGKFDYALALPPGARAGKPEFVWSANRDRLNMLWPVSQLPAQTGAARLTLRGIGQITVDGGQIRYHAGANQSAVFSETIPSFAEIFHVLDLKLAVESNAALDERYILEITTTLEAGAADVAQNLQVRQLPEFHSPTATRRPYDWTVAPAIPKEIIEKSELLAVAPLQRADDMVTRFRFEVPAQSGRYLLVRLDNKLKAGGGEPLARNWHGIIRAVPLEGRVGFLQPGNILPCGGKIDIFASDVDRVEWEAQLLREPFLALLAQGSGDAYKEPMEKIGLSLDSFSKRASGAIAISPAAQGQARYASLDLGKIIHDLSGQASGIVLLSLRGMREDKLEASAQRVIMATDLGLIVKRARDGKLDCFTRNLKMGAPAANVQVQILGANGEAVATAVTDARGHVAIASLNGMARELQPVCAVARRDGNFAFMPLADRSRQIDFSNFDVGGAHVDASGAIAFVFAQRGLFRPGDMVCFGCLPRKADFSLLPANTPLVAELRDPRGRRVFEKVFQAGENGIAELQWQAPESALSGPYVLNVKNGRDGDVLGSTTVRIESFQPETLRMKLQAPAAKGWLVAAGAKTENLAATLLNFYGAPAAGRLVKAFAQITPAQFRFAGLEDWTFTDPAPFMGGGHRLNLAEVKTDAEGRASITLPCGEFGSASARVAVVANGFELSGANAANAVTSFIVSPMRQILGWRPAGALTNPDFINQHAEACIDLLSVNSELEPAAWEKLAFSILRRQYVTSLISDGQGGCRYDETSRELTVKTWQADLPAAGLRVNVDTSEPGEFLLAVRDASGRILARIPYNVAGESLRDASAQLAASKMRMRIDKKEYEPGAEINISLAMPYDATGLLSIERDGVAAFEWINVHAGDNVAKIRIPADFEGSGHVIATFARAADSDAIYMAPLAFYAQPFVANTAGRELKIAIDAPESARPGDHLEVAISAPKAAQALIFAVDEGILGMTGYATPKPLATLLAGRALDVTTLQLADLLMPEHSRLAPRLAAFGGGAEGGVFGARFQNPFKRKLEPPLAWWSGIVSIGPEAKTVRIPLPAWCAGQLRVMAVASDAASAGSVMRQVAVKGPLALMPALPLAVAPGDVFEGALTVANTTDAPMRASLEMDAGADLELVKPLAAEIDLAPQEERALFFTFKALDRPGAPAVKFRASAGNEQFSRIMSLSVRPPSALRATLAAGMTEKSGPLPPMRPVYREMAQSEAAISGLPLPLAQGLARYLETYPYGCAEQLTSRAFGQALLAKWPQAAADVKTRQKLLDEAMSAIVARFREGSGVSLWDGGEPDLLLTAYVADYLLTLRESGLGGAEDLLGRVCDALRWNAALNEPTIEAARASAYAIWILAREGRIVTQMLEELEQAILEKGIKNWRGDVTWALMAAAMREMRMSGSLRLDELGLNGSGWFNEYAQYSLAMAILARYFPENLTAAQKRAYFEAAAMRINANDFSTFASTQGIRALAWLAGADAPALLQDSLRCLDEDVAQEADLLANGAFLVVKAPQCSRYGIKLADPGHAVFWQTTTIGFDRDPQLQAVAHGLEISAVLEDASGKPVQKAAQGQELFMRIKARADGGSVSDCVISSILPGGLEMIIPRKGAEWQAGIKAIDRREDRILVFADLGETDLEFLYPVRAVTPGQYIAPGAYVEAMYDRALYGASAGGRLEITRQ